MWNEIWNLMWSIMWNMMWTEIWRYQKRWLELQKQRVIEQKWNIKKTMRQNMLKKNALQSQPWFLTQELTSPREMKKKIWNQTWMNLWNQMWEEMWQEMWKELWMEIEHQKMVLTM